MIDISAFGTGLTIVATTSFPVGFQVTSFADDEAPLDISNVEVSGYEKLYDGTIFTYDKTSPILLSIGVLPNTSDDINLKVLMQQRKSSAQLNQLADTTSLIIKYADGGYAAMSNGSIISGALADSLTTQGRKKGNAYHFVFGTFAGAQSATELVATVAQNALALL
jgi:hypothetical protein